MTSVRSLSVAERLEASEIGIGRVRLDTDHNAGSGAELIIVTNLAAARITIASERRADRAQACRQSGVVVGQFANGVIYARVLVKRVAGIDAEIAAGP